MTFPLKICTPTHTAFDGEAVRLILRTPGGDLAILPRHIDCVAPIRDGAITVETPAERKTGQCTKGFLTVQNGTATVIAREFHWPEG